MHSFHSSEYVNLTVSSRHFFIYSTAIIQIQLKNQGSDAFKPDRYGRSIKVERKISRDGTGSYKLISEDGKSSLLQITKK